jgi:hypothetical protein
MQEPRDGDFVAYIEALQRESAARLAQQRVHAVEEPAPREAAGHFFESKGKAVQPVSIERAVQRFVRRDADAKTIKAIVAGVVGAVFLLTWLGNGSPFAFVLAAALFVYALPRLLAAFRGGAKHPSNRAAVDHVFGRSAPPTKETEP